MIRRTLPLTIALLAVLTASDSAQAFDGLSGGFPGWPYASGFYQPYGIRYSTSVRTPPHFAVNPPVYYGARHTRPYGVSPFAAMPAVGVSEGYRSRPADAQIAPAPLLCNPFCLPATTSEPTELIEPPQPLDEGTPMAGGPLRENPFAISKLAASDRRVQ